ncbi:MAG TPA: hypothetical protein VEL07_19285 [Planctomycetota bacterium]|nr:hypothetical protein [Planctomycetota bacterium]
MLRALLSLVALCEALATASFITTPRMLSKQSRFLGPLRLAVERAALVGGATVWGANFLGEANANRQDFLATGAATTYDSALVYVAFANYNWLVKVDRSTRTGTAAVTAGSKTVTGTGTDFDPELTVGDEIQINGEQRRVVSITSDTVLTVDEAFQATASGAAIFLVDAVLRHTTDFTIADNGGFARLTIPAAAKLPANAKVSLHYVTPVSLLSFATATTQFRRVELPNGFDLMWYVSDATATPSATNVYVEPVGT